MAGIGDVLMGLGGTLNPDVATQNAARLRQAQQNKRQLQMAVLDKAIQGVQDGSLDPSVLDQMVPGLSRFVQPSLTARANNAFLSGSQAPQSTPSQAAPNVPPLLARPSEGLSGAPSALSGQSKLPPPPAAPTGLAALSPLAQAKYKTDMLNWQAQVKYQGAQSGPKPSISISPQNFTPESWKAYTASGNLGDLVPINKETDSWSAPYQLNGAYVQKNTKTGQIRQVVSSQGAGTTGDFSTIPPALQGLHGDAFLKMLPPSVAAETKALAEGRLPISTRSFQSPRMRPLIERAMQYDPTFDASTYQVRQRVRADFTSGPTSKNITALNTAIGHLGTMYDLGEAMKNKDLRAQNALLNKISVETGKPNVTNFEIARSAVGNELTRVFRQVGASESETRDWENKFSSSSSWPQLKSAIKVAADLLQSRIGALNDQWRRGMNTKQGYPDMLSPKSVGVFKKIGGEIHANVKQNSVRPAGVGADWTLMTDKDGNTAWVSPDGKNYKEVK